MIRYQRSNTTPRISTAVRFSTALVAGTVLIAAWLAPAAAASTTPSRVLAIGDVHGAYEPLVEILQAASLIDDHRRWIGGDATLVQVGDFLDRGAGVFDVMDLLMRLEDEAPRQGGRVIVLLGNHEIMNLIGFRRDVSRAVYARLMRPDSAERREKLYRAAAELYRRRHKGAPPEGFELDWKRKHPLGYLEYCELLSPEGQYGRWLRSLPSAVKIDDTFFLHAGLSPEMGVPDAETLNAWVREDLAAYDDYRRLLGEHGLILPVTDFAELTAISKELAGGSVMLASLDGSKARVRQASRALEIRRDGWIPTDSQGPLWFRGFAKWPRVEGARNVRTLGRQLGVEHFVVGHSPVRDRQIHHRFDGSIFLTDTGMLAEHYRDGRPAILERFGERWTAIYLDDRQVLLGPGPRQALAATTWKGPDGEELPFRDDEEALEFLKSAQVVSHQVLGGGSNHTLKVLLENDGVRAFAAFRTVNLKQDRVTLGKEILLDFHDSYVYEVAAYEASRLLGLDMIPPAVLREIDGEPGSLQLWVEGTMTESKRYEAKIEAPKEAGWYRQLQTMRIFDRLIFNYDRNRGNMLIDEDWRLWMIDHTRSFRISTDVTGVATITSCERDLWRRLRELDEDEAKARLLPYVSVRKIKALLKRRDKIVGHIEGLIERFGEAAVIFPHQKEPTPEEEVYLAGADIESFLRGLPNESEIPPELRAASPAE